jgi:hypothetical protein
MRKRIWRFFAFKVDIFDRLAAVGEQAGLSIDQLIYCGRDYGGDFI